MHFDPGVDAKRRQLSRRLTIVALVPLLISAGLFLYGGITDHVGTVLIPVILIAAMMIIGWRAPGVAGVLLLLFSPIGFFLVLLGSTNLDPTSQVIEELVSFAGVPLGSGVLLVVAQLVEPKGPMTLAAENRSRYGRESESGPRSTG